MHRDRVDMPWDGALPMLRHGPLQLKVIAFPVSPSSFFPSLLLPPRFLFFSKWSVSPFLAPVPALLFVPRLLPSSFPLSHSGVLFPPLEPPSRDGYGPAAALLTALRVCDGEHVYACVCVCEGEACVSEGERGKRWACSSAAGA